MFGVDLVDPGRVAGLELPDQRTGLATEEARRCAVAELRRLQRGGRSDEERPSLLGERQVGDVRDRVGVVRETAGGSAGGVPVDHARSSASG